MLVSLRGAFGLWQMTGPGGCSRPETNGSLEALVWRIDGYLVNVVPVSSDKSADKSLVSPAAPPFQIYAFFSRPFRLFKIARYCATRRRGGGQEGRKGGEALIRVSAAIGRFSNHSFLLLARSCLRISYGWRPSTRTNSYRSRTSRGRVTGDSAVGFGIGTSALQPNVRPLFLTPIGGTRFVIDHCLYSFSDFPFFFISFSFLSATATKNSKPDAVEMATVRRPSSTWSPAAESLWPERRIDCGRRPHFRSVLMLVPVSRRECGDSCFVVSARFVALLFRALEKRRLNRPVREKGVGVTRWLPPIPEKEKKSPIQTTLHKYEYNRTVLLTGCWPQLSDRPGRTEEGRMEDGPAPPVGRQSAGDKRFHNTNKTRANASETERQRARNRLGVGPANGKSFGG